MWCPETQVKKEFQRRWMITWVMWDRSSGMGMQIDYAFSSWWVTVTLASAILSSDGDETMTTVRSRGNESEGIGATSIDQSFKAFHCERSRERYGSLKKANTSALAEEPPAKNSLPSEGTAFTHMVGRCSEG